MTFYQLRILYLMAFCLCLTVKAAAQQPVIEDGFRMLTFRDGLAGTSVTDIITDHNGEMWIATSNGVNTYNGKRLTTFKLGEESLQNHVYHVYEAPDHHILATTANGIFSIGYGDNGFQRIVPQISTAETLLPWNGDTLFIGNRDGLHIFDGQKLKTILVADTPMDMANSVRDIHKGSDGRVWFVSKYALNAFNPANEQLESFRIANQMPEGASLNRMAFCGQTCYIGTKNDGLYAYSLERHEVRRIKGVGNVVSSLRCDSDGMLCVGTDGSGAYLIQPANDSIVRHFESSAQDSERIVSNAVYCYYHDKYGVDWFGYFRFGLTHTFHIEHLFKHYRYQDFTTEGISVRCYDISPDYQLIGTTDGFYFIDTKRQIVRHVTPRELDGAHIVTSIARYGDYYYIGSYDGGLRRFDPQSMTISKMPFEEQFDHLTVTKLIVNPTRNSLCMATSIGLLVLESDNTLRHYDESNSRLGGGTVSDISFDDKGNAWLSSSPGLTLYDMTNSQFQSQGFPEGFFNDVRSLKGCQGHDGLQFFYNSDNVYYTDTRLQNFGRLQFPKAMDKELKLSFSDDMQGHYWISNELGLYRFDYGLKHMQYYGEGEGIVCQFITDGSLQIDSMNQLWFGSSNGLFYTKLEELEQWQQNVRHNILLYQMRVNGESLSEIKEAVINDQKTLTLTWNIKSQMLQAIPVVTDYTRSAGRIFEYRIDNNEQWTIIGDEQPLTIKGLMLGRHTLHVRMSGLPNTEKTYTVTVVPSLPAIIELVLIIIAIALLLWWRNYRHNTNLLLSERDTMEAALVELEQAQEQNEQAQERQKYERVKVNETECEEIVRRVRKYVETQKPYQNPDLKMSDLAEVLSLSTSKLSQVFNLYLNENYYEFINNYRLAEFKRRIDAGDAERFTLIALSEQCGFKKSSFFATFRRIEGMTPTEYLKKKHKL